MMFVLFQLLLRQREHLFAQQRTLRLLNPICPRPFMTTNLATRQGLSLTLRARDTLPEPLLGLAIASRASICGIARVRRARGY